MEEDHVWEFSSNCHSSQRGGSFTLDMLMLVSKHCNDVLLDGSNRTREFPGNTNNFVVLDYCFIHKILGVRNLPFFEIIHFVANPLCPSFRLKDFAVNCEQVLNLLSFELSTSGSC